MLWLGPGGPLRGRARPERPRRVRAGAPLTVGARRRGGREVQELFPSGIGMHHAGMLRADRTLMERAFSAGLIKARPCGLPAPPATRGRGPSARAREPRARRRCCAPLRRWPGASTCRRTRSSSRARSCTTRRRAPSRTWVRGRTPVQALAGGERQPLLLPWGRVRQRKAGYSQPTPHHAARARAQGCWTCSRSSAAPAGRSSRTPALVRGPARTPLARRRRCTML